MRKSFAYIEVDLDCRILVRLRGNPYVLSSIFLPSQYPYFYKKTQGMNIQEKIGQVVKRLRQVSHLTQEQLSGQCGMDQHYLSNIESGQRNVSVEVVERIASFFNLPLSSFFSLVEGVQDTPVQTVSSISANELEQGFVRYMKEHLLSERTIRKYSVDTPNSPSVQEIIKSVTGSTRNMYRVTDLHKLDKIIDKVSASDFDMIGHSMYSAGLKKFKQFLESIS